MDPRSSSSPVPLSVSLRGRQLIDEPRLNKSTAFTLNERDAFGLRGLLPARVSTIEEQVTRELGTVRGKQADLDRFIGLIALLDRNETVFYRLLVEHLEELLPYVYTPTVGLGCQRYSQIFRQPRGVWITPEDIDHIEDILRSVGADRIRLMVVTDNERILGLGDLGAGGMGISIGKLALYIAGAGIHPSVTLPVSLDVGTTNQTLLDDPTYIGWRHERIRGARYEEFLDAFVAAVATVCPHAIVQWEDFKQHNAIAVLDRYRDRLPTFNDDIQGTSGVAMGGILASLRRTGTRLEDQRVVFLGAGAAGIGIARLTRTAMAEHGPAPSAAHRSIAMLDSRGLLVEGRSGVKAEKAEFAMTSEEARGYGLEPGADLEAVVRAFRPTILIGTTGIPGTFTEGAIRAMADAVEVPIIFPLSNPTSHSEATPAEICRWTDDRALIATGSPFDAIETPHGRIVIGQANNAFIFPGLGLGAIVSELREIPDHLFLAAADVLASTVDAERLALGALYPSPSDLRTVSRQIACRVVREATAAGLGRPIPDELVGRTVDDAMWFPDYVPYAPA